MFSEKKRSNKNVQANVNKVRFIDGSFAENVFKKKTREYF